jgi:hypothetical protein
MSVKFRSADKHQRGRRGEGHTRTSRFAQRKKHGTARGAEMCARSADQVNAGHGAPSMHMRCKSPTACTLHSATRACVQRARSNLHIDPIRYSRRSSVSRNTIGTARACACSKNDKNSTWPLQQRSMRLLTRAHARIAVIFDCGNCRPHQGMIRAHLLQNLYRCCCCHCYRCCQQSRGRQQQPLHLHTSQCVA